MDQNTMHQTAGLDLVTVPCLSDNYAFLLHDPATGGTAVVDVPEVAPILAALETRGWQLTHILLTHHHPDHVQGVDALRTATGAKVFGAAADSHRLPKLDRAVMAGGRFDLFGEEVQVIDVSGHTIGHIAYYLPGSGYAFTGDSLMAWGCGRLFEGKPAMMWDSLSRLAALPAETILCSGHEYTLSNGRFALTIEPENAALISRFAATEAARAEGRPTVPSRLSEELATNPFLRAGNPQVKSSLSMEKATDAEVFGEIRARKDRF